MSNRQKFNIFLREQTVLHLVPNITVYRIEVLIYYFHSTADKPNNTIIIINLRFLKHSNGLDDKSILY